MRTLLQIHRSARKADRFADPPRISVWHTSRWTQTSHRWAGGCASLLFAAAALAQAPLSLPVNADGSFNLPLGAELIADESGPVAFDVDSLAGAGTAGHGGDGGLATEAVLHLPYGVSVDSAGNVFIADALNHRVRRIDAETGLIETLAGAGERGFEGDGGPAPDALLSFPRGIAVDAAGNVYVADTNNHRVRAINAETGRIQTLAGTGQRGFGGDGGLASGAMLRQPSGVAVDSAGNVYVADTANNRVRKIDVQTGLIETLAGTGEHGHGGDGGPASAALLGQPSGVAVDSAGNVYVADTANNRVRKIDAQTGLIGTLAGTGQRGFEGDGGLASEASLRLPVGVAVDSAGDVYVTDTYSNRVRRVAGQTGLIETLAGTGESGFGGDGGPASEALLNQPSGVALDPAGNVYVADRRNHRVRLLSPQMLVKIPLGTDGESIILAVSKDGSLRLDRELLLDGAVVVAASGKRYELALGSDGGLLASQVSREPGPAEVALLDRDWMAAADATMVTALLDIDPAAIGIMDADARTPLHFAAAGNSDPAVARVLLDRGASATALDAQGRFPLHYAALGSENRAVAELLIERGADPFQIDNNVKTALELATASGNSTVAELLGDVVQRYVIPDPHQVPTWRLLYGDWARSATVASVTAVLDADPGAISREVGLSYGLLHRVALMNPDPAVTRLLLERGADANVETSLGRPAIANAAANRNPEVTRLLLEHGADATDPAALSSAARNTNPEVLELLLEHGADATDPRLLWRAATNHNPAVARLLLDRGADPNARYQGTPPLVYAAQNRNAAVAELLLDRGAYIDEHDGRLRYALHVAVSRGNVAVVRLLLNRGTQALSFENFWGRTPLWQAVNYPGSSPAVLQLLIDAIGGGANTLNVHEATHYYRGSTAYPGDIWHSPGAGPNSISVELFARGSSAQVEQWFDDVSKLGKDPLSIVNTSPWAGLDLGGLHWAALNPDLGVVKTLLDRGTKFYTPEASGNEKFRTMAGLRRAVRSNSNPAVAELLLDHVGGIDLAGPYGWTLLHWAAWNPNPAMAEMLLDRGLEVDATSIVGVSTALLEAARWNSNPAVAEVLVNRGADVEATNDGDATPLLLSWTRPRSAVAALLLDKGAQHVVLEERLLDLGWVLEATPTQLESQVINASDDSLFFSKLEDVCGRTALHNIGFATAANEYSLIGLSEGPSQRFDDYYRALRLFNERAPGRSAIQALDARGSTFLHYVVAGAAENGGNFEGGLGRAVGLRGARRFQWGWSNARREFQETTNENGLQAAHYASYARTGDFSVETPLTREIGAPRYPYGNFTLDPLSGEPFPASRIPGRRFGPCLPPANVPPSWRAGAFARTLVELRETWRSQGPAPTVAPPPPAP